jgi:hypothetical protein
VRQTYCRTCLSSSEAPIDLGQEVRDVLICFFVRTTRHGAAGASEGYMTELTLWKEITTQFEGRPISGSYAIESGLLKVRTPHGEKTAQLGFLSPIFLAARLLRELAEEGKV